MSLPPLYPSLMVKTAGRPTPAVTWLFNGRKVEDDYSTELGKDGSLVLVSVELKHAGTYTFTVSNRVGSVEGCTKLVVRTEDEESASVPRVESNPVTREKFGEYVSSFHAHNNSAFIGQFQVIDTVLHMIYSIYSPLQQIMHTSLGFMVYNNSPSMIVPALSIPCNRPHRYDPPHCV